MRPNRFTMAALCLSGLLAFGSARAGTITHTSASDFKNGISDGIVQAMQETSLPSGAVGVMPGLGASLVNDDFNYTTSADASAKYLFLTPNTTDHGELATYPSQFLFSGDTPSVPEASAPAPGVLRLHCSRNQDFYNSGLEGQRSPMFAINKTILTGDFVVETKVNIVQPRGTNGQRVDGIYIGTPASYDTVVATDVPLDDTTLYFVSGATVDPVARAISRSRVYPKINGYPVNYTSVDYTGQTFWIRVVKRGAYFFSYIKTAENDPWAFHQWIKNPDLAASPGLVVGLIGISWGGTSSSAIQYQDDDFEYLRVNRIAGLAGSYTNVFDAGFSADWQTLSFNSTSKQGVKYQFRAGNTLASGTLTDAGAFVGPDGSSATFFTDDAAQVTGAAGKRYLEYKLVMDAATPSPGTAPTDPTGVPVFVRSISATFHPAGLTGKLLSTATDFGADAGGIQTQTGGGDVSLQRTQIYSDDFTATTLDGGWLFDPGYTVLDPAAVGDYSLTERPGFFRMKVGYPQDFYVGTTKYGGVKLLRNLPANIDSSNFEIETEVNMDTQAARMAALVLSMDQNNYVGIGLARRFSDTYDIGPIEDIVLNNLSPSANVYNYGSDTLQLRITKRGTVVTFSFRDPNSASPSWRVLSSLNTKGMATGGADFVPVQFGFLGKSYDLADQATFNYDYNYISVANLAASGQRDFTLTLPAGSHPDTLLAFADGSSVSNLKAQVQTSGGTFVGPDGTSSTYFTTNEPKLPAALDGITNTSLRLFLGATAAAANPYVHAAGLQYAIGSNRVVRDTNATDFAAATVKNGVDTTTVPGIVTPTVGTGSSVTEDFNPTATGWLFSNTPGGGSTFSLTERPGWARMNVQAPCDTWGGGSATEKPRCFLYYGTALTGDFELETHIDMQNGRDEFRHMGLGFIAPLAGGTPPDTNLDTTNLLCYGPYRTTDMRFLRGDNNAFADFGPGGYTANSYYLRLRKTGALFTGSCSEDGINWTETGTYTFSHLLPTVYVGFFSKAWYLASGVLPLDFEYFKISKLTTNGTYVSRVLDLGASGLTPSIDTLGGNSALAQIQYRAADTAAGLTALPYVGPDGTSSTYFAGDYTGPLPASFTGKQYFQYSAMLIPDTQVNDIAIVGTAAASAPLTRDDAANALRIAGGLQLSSAADLSRLDVVKGSSAGKIGVEDAVSIWKTVNGL